MTEEQIPGDALPVRTEWHYIGIGKIFWKFKNEPYIFYKASKITFFPLIFCYLASGVIYAYWYHNQYQYIPESGRDIVNWVFRITLLMCWIAFFVCWKTNPGFLPYDWNMDKRSWTSYTLDELRSGFARSKDQVRHGKEFQGWPNRCFFSGRVGVGVVKADHICQFIAHWIGLNNMRFFIQAIIYGSIAIFCAGIGCIFQFREIGFTRKGALVTICIVYLGLQYLGQWTKIYNRIVYNMTVLEEAALPSTRRAYHEYNKGVLGNLEEIFGPVKYCWLWWLPIALPLPDDGMNFVPHVSEEQFLLATNGMHRTEALRIVYI